MTFKKKNIIICLLLLLIVQNTFVLAQQNNDRFRGVDFRDLHLSPVDSAVLRINSTWYSGWNQYGPVSSSSDTFYKKWRNEKEKYYPLMKESWKYCIDHQPYQVNLYKDGVKLNLWMFQDSISIKDYDKRMKYFDEAMKVYDMWAQNIDSVNDHVRRISDKSSVGGIMMKKARDYTQYIIPGKDVYSDEIAKQMFVAAAETIRSDFNLDKDLGGDIDQGGLQYYLGFAVNDYGKIVTNSNEINIPNYKSITIINKNVKEQLRDTAKIKKLAPNYSIEKLEEMEKHNQYVDSLKRTVKQDLRQGKEPLLEKYNFIIELCTRQINSLSGDYDDEKGGADSLDIVMRNVVEPYKQLKEICANMLKNNAHIDVAIQHLKDVEIQYGIDLDSHKKDKKWLHLVLDICENTIDFTKDNLSYPFYEEVYKYYDEIPDEPGPSPSPNPRPSKVINPWAKKADALWKSLPTNQWIQEKTGLRGALVMYYYSRAIATDPANKTTYQANRRTLRAAVKGCLMMNGIYEGQVVTVDGITFKLDFK